MGREFPIKSVRLDIIVPEGFDVSKLREVIKEARDVNVEINYINSKKPG